MGFQQIKSITVRYEDGSETDGKFILGEDDNQYTLALEVKDMSLNSTGEDYFEALSKIREELAAFKAVPVCYGASRNVFPSRHSRRFERGLKAYKMSKGNTAKTGDLVYIFDSGEDVDPATPDEQRVYFREWLASLE